MDLQWSADVSGRLRVQWAGAAVAGLLSAMAGLTVLMLLSATGLFAGRGAAPREVLVLGPLGFFVGLVVSSRPGRGTLRYHEGALLLDLGYESPFALQPRRTLRLLDATLEHAPGADHCVLASAGTRWEVGAGPAHAVRLEAEAFSSFTGVVGAAIAELGRRREQALERARAARPALPLRLEAETGGVTLLLSETSAELLRGGQVAVRLPLPLARAQARTSWRSTGKRKRYDGPALELVAADGQALRIHFGAASRHWLHEPPPLRRRADCTLPSEALEPLCQWLGRVGVMNAQLLLQDAISYDLTDALAGVKAPPAVVEPPRAASSASSPARAFTPRDGTLYMGLGALFLLAAGATWLVAPRLGVDPDTPVLALGALGGVGLVGGLLHRLGLVDMNRFDDG